MKKIYEPFPIEDWKKIAYKVRQLHITSGPDGKFKKDLEQLNKLLKEFDIYTESLSRKPKTKNEIGSASLLQSIYNSNYQKNVFYDKIMELADLGIKEIEFRPAEFYSSATGLYHLKKKNGQMISKCLTDGKFHLSCDLIAGEHFFSMTMINHANYLLSIGLKSDDNENTEIISSKVTIKNFEGYYPEKKEIMAMSFPYLHSASQFLEWGSSPEVRQGFNYLDDKSSNIQKSKYKSRR